MSDSLTSMLTDVPIALAAGATAYGVLRRWWLAAIAAAMALRFPEYATPALLLTFLAAAAVLLSHRRHGAAFASPRGCTPIHPDRRTGTFSTEPTPRPTAYDAPLDDDDVIDAEFEVIYER